MRKFLFIAAVALLGTLGLSACQKGEQTGTATQAKATRPTDAEVDAAVKDCLAKHPKASAPATSGTAAGASDSSEEDDMCSRANVSASTWQPYMQQIVTENLGDITNAPYAYFVPSGKYPENQGAISRVQDSLNGTIIATVLPGNMIAVGGPDSATTAQVLETAFKQASPGSFKGVVVLFMGDKADEAAVKAAVDPSGATLKFAQM
ncbi:MAG: hypothetical protein OJF55_000124 [Rhodanobacteraceae bacterium]|jgi:hypothetical protein|nr:MAG: hypothetical protein OJF55_000124 [Rhodanobacteraceae bacterium]